MSRHRDGKEFKKIFSLRDEPRTLAWIVWKFGSKQKFWNAMVKMFRNEINSVDEQKKDDRKKT